MGILSKLFNSSYILNDHLVLPWQHITRVEAIDAIKAQSLTKAQLIFKYSTRCGISRMMMTQFEEDYDFNDHDFDLYFLDVIAYRDVSNQIADTFEVVHETPQLLVINNTVLVAQASHGRIANIDLNRFV